MNRVTVLHTRIVTGAGGGPEKTILNSPRFLRGTRYRELACYLRAPGDAGFEAIRRRAVQHDCPLIEVDDRGPFDLSVLRRLAAVCRTQGVQIWHAHDYKTNLLGLLLRPLAGFRLVTTVHGWVSLTPRTRLYYALDRATLPFYEQVIAVSSDIYDRCLGAGVAPHRLHLVENAIDTDTFTRSAPAGRAALRPGASAGRLLIGAMGRLAPEKGFDLLIQAVGRLLAEGFDLELWIAGEGPALPDLQRLAVATGQAGRIRFLGFQADPRPFLEALDVFCLSSRREGLPNVVLEAMSMEVPLLATRCGGLAAFGRDEQDMLLVEPDAAEPIAAGLRRLAGDHELRRRLAAEARRRVVAECGFGRRMRRMAEIYDLAPR